MKGLKYDKHGNPDPDLRQVEDAIRKSRFEEGEAERFLRTRSARKAQQLAFKKYRDEGRRIAFIAGYKAAAERKEIWLLPFALMLLFAIYLVQSV